MKKYEDLEARILPTVMSSCYKQHDISIFQVVIQENSKQALQTFLKDSYRQHACACVVPLLKNSLSNAHVPGCRCTPVYDLIINELQRHLKHLI